MALVFPLTGDHWWLTCVYGPQEDAPKIAFLNEMQDVRVARPGPWVVCGDFNKLYRDEDKSNDNLHRCMMG